MQFKIIILFALVAALVASEDSTKKPENPNGAKNKRGLVEFGYGYGLDSDFEQYSYSPYTAALTPRVQPVVTKEVSLPTVHQSSIAVPVEKYVEVPSYAIFNRFHYPPVKVPKTQPIVLKLAQPYSVSYVKQHHVPSQFISTPPASPPIVYEKYTNLNKYSPW